MVLFLLKQPESQSQNLANAISQMRLNVNFCKKCHNISDSDICEICANPRRDESIICVVEDIRDVMAIEKTSSFNGLYHVLGGKISPVDGIGPDDLNISSLVEKVKNNVKQNSHFSRLIYSNEYFSLKNLYIPFTLENIQFKDKVKFGTNVLVGKNVKIGSNCLIGHNSIIETNVSIGDNCTIGSNVIIRNSLIKNNVHILDGCIIGKKGFGFFS